MPRCRYQIGDWLVAKLQQTDRHTTCRPSRVEFSRAPAIAEPAQQCSERLPPSCAGPALSARGLESPQQPSVGFHSRGHQSIAAVPRKPWAGRLPTFEGGSRRRREPPLSLQLVAVPCAARHMAQWDCEQELRVLHDEIGRADSRAGVPIRPHPCW